MLTLFLLLKRFLRPSGREAFIASLPAHALVLDVGCGNDSPYVIKAQRPDIEYVGIDVSNYNHQALPSAYADHYLICTPEKFAATIKSLEPAFDAVISSHNIEHCEDPAGVLAAMVDALKPGGQLFMAWPAEHTVRLPSRRGTLNFYDDATHRHMPRFDNVLASVSASGAEPVFRARAYRPVLPLIIGALLEPLSMLTKRLMPLRSTWALHGFESVAWFKKR